MNALPEGWRSSDSGRGATDGHVTVELHAYEIEITTQYTSGGSLFSHTETAYHYVPIEVLRWVLAGPDQEVTR